MFGRKDSKKDFKPDPNKVAELQKKYTGLEDDLKYRTGHTICNKFNAYKMAGEKASAAIATYKTTAEPLKVRRCKDAVPGDPVTGPVRAAYYTRGSHQILVPLAGAAATNASLHADRRDSFNNRYQDVLEAKEQWKGHVDQAKNARRSAENYTEDQAKHRMFSRAS